MTVAASKPYQLPAFIFITALIAFAVYAIVQDLSAWSNPRLFAHLITGGFVTAISLCYHFLLVRGRGWAKVTTGLVFLLSLYGSTFLFPEEYEVGFTVLIYLALPIELGLLGYVAYHATRTIRRINKMEPAAQSGMDIMERLRYLMREAFEVKVLADVLAYELSVLYYAFFSWRRADAVTDTKSLTFTYHRTSGYGTTLAAIMIAIVVEVAVLHYLLSLWSPLAAWIHTALVIYGTFWLVGDYRATRLRPITATPTALTIRCGLRWDASIPWENITGIEPASWKTTKGDSYHNASAANKESLIITLAEPIIVDGPYMITRQCQSLGISVDEPEAVLRALRARVTSEAHAVHA